MGERFLSHQLTNTYILLYNLNLIIKNKYREAKQVNERITINGYWKIECTS